MPRFVDAGVCERGSAHVCTWMWMRENEINLEKQIHLTKIHLPPNSDLREQTWVYFKILFS